ncbi:transmembrane channel-like protein 7 isoform X2 [Culicoides brevitarsis]|uniref:transmembrane channel-like protein 7 isoform X2 n=1 Tax=Culicoides brevitarsis TaxID=469753 RepID=UPI00307BA664
MSGGAKSDRKSKSSSKTQGWEEAGAEFYQESYPGDLEGLQRSDPSKLATLLPSKQNRNATTRRQRSGSQYTYTKGTRRRPSYQSQTGQGPLTTTIRTTAATVTRRGSQYQEVQVAMLPDLSENLTDEERTWDEIREIKAMPVPMAQKKEMKAQLQNATKLRLQGFDQIKWQRRKFWQRFKKKYSAWMTKMELWHNSLKKIEGHFGTGVVAFFFLIRWLAFLNLSVYVLIFLFIVLPQVMLHEQEDIPCAQLEPNSTQCCTEAYLNGTRNSTFSEFFVLEIIQGRGIMERTWLFYGMYTNQIFGYVSENFTSSNANGTYDPGMYYDLPLAYISTTVFYYLLILVAIVRSAAKEFKDRLVENEGQFYQYCTLIFGGWDFCIDNEKSAVIKHKALYNEIRALIHQKRLEFERTNRTKELMLKLIAVRFVVNLIVVIILAVAAVIIYLLFNVSLQHLEPNFRNEHANSFRDIKNYVSIYLSSNTNSTGSSLLAGPIETDALPDSLGGSTGGAISSFGTSNVVSDEIQAEPYRTGSILSSEVPWEDQMTILFFEFLPYLGIVCLNLLVPLLFNYLVKFEDYSPMFVIKVTLLRTVFLRLSSLAVLLSRFYHLISKNVGTDKCFNEEKGTPACWETFVGQSFFKLIFTDFLSHCLVTFFINFPRALISRHFDSKFAKFIGDQEFELSKHCLDLVYSQTLVWLGSFFAPFLPLIASVLNFCMFYVKKFACLHNCKPSLVHYRASRSNSLFMLVLMLGFVVAVVPVAYSITEILPSRSCGPFRGNQVVWDVVTSAFLKAPDFIQNIVFFVGTRSFAVPFFITLILFLYYYSGVSAANRKYAELLRNQLVLEGHDKSFLLSRLTAVIARQQQLQQEAHNRAQKRGHHNDVQRDKVSLISQKK